MTKERAIELLNIEKECVNRNCDRDCLHCDLLQTQEELNEMYDYVIEKLKGGAEK